MNGRFFDGRRIEASLYVGRQRFKRSGAGDDLEESEDSDKKRLDDFANWLMTEGD
jgi:HIV Tat-specific factor 1